MPKPRRPLRFIHEALPVRAAARQTGLTPDLIRAWEKRYGVVAPQRGPRGARLYSADDITRLRLLQQLVSAGRSIGDIAHLTPKELEALVARARPRAAEGTEPRVPRRLIEALERFDADMVYRALGESLLALGAASFVRDVAGPLLVEVGERWGDGRLSVADEHLVSGLLRNLLGGLVHARAGWPGPRIVLATPPGEHHDLGLVMAGLLAVDAGLSLYFLGAEVPAADIVRSAQRAGAAVVGLSLVDGDNHKQALAAIRSVTRALPQSTELWLGGRAAEPIAGDLGSRRCLMLADPTRLEAELRRVRDSAMPSEEQST